MPALAIQTIKRSAVSEDRTRGAQILITATEVRPKPWRAVYGDALTALSPGVLAGSLCGAVIGGVGGRLAMLFLRITSRPSLHVLETDDGLTICPFTEATV